MKVWNLNLILIKIKLGLKKNENDRIEIFVKNMVKKMRLISL